MDPVQSLELCRGRFFTVQVLEQRLVGGTYYELPVGRQEPSSIGFDHPILSAEPKLHCKPVKL